ncbi:MAG: shikimate kinase AroK [Gammaproteobacteria bacterium]|nr:shikimate kinase AroK [Gammaproteobacteria bacterium]
MKSTNIFLIGPMGAGKTTVGRVLAQKLSLTFIDSDHEIENHTGVDIPLIFEKEGEQGFRKREAEIIDELTSKHNIVLATGGGAVIREDNRQHLINRGLVIYLQADIKHLLRRTRKDRNRPLLQGTDPEKKLRQIMQEREAFYLQTADHVIDTGKHSVQAIINQIIELQARQNPLS